MSKHTIAFVVVVVLVTLSADQFLHRTPAQSKKPDPIITQPSQPAYPPVPEQVHQALQQEKMYAQQLASNGTEVQIARPRPMPLKEPISDVQWVSTEDRNGDPYMAGGVNVIVQWKERVPAPPANRPYIAKFYLDPNPQYTKNHIRKKLTSRNMLFIGDSTLRYLFICLLEMLEGIPFNAKVDNRVNAWTSPTPQMREEALRTQPYWNRTRQFNRIWDGPSEYVTASTEMFKGNRLCCDCAREEQPNKDTHRDLFYHNQRESRFYYDPSIEARLSFVFTFGGLGARGSAKNYEECHQKQPLGPDWEGKLLAELVSQFKKEPRKYDTIVLNNGLWGVRGEINNPGKIIEAVEEALTDDGIVIWLGCLKQCHRSDELYVKTELKMLEGLKAAAKKKWKFVDAYHIMSSLVPFYNLTQDKGLSVVSEKLKCSEFYLDPTGHVQPFVNSEMAQQMLRLL
eukprot:TRINITY_DN16530_c0_g2_i1.p1 TRINITY_DN16530_c0_g2~~TRINITY_DN16530_c0_g2_i1.p1  ORF type:complete len:455 (+),score=63.69 TRINITY_DN16530_c0_g2_i1:46-1410(+)